MKRLPSTFAVLCMVVMAQHALAAQAPTTPASPVFSVIKPVGTPDEQSLLKSLTDKLRAKTADPTFAKSLDDATGRRDYATARRLVAGALGVKATQVAIVVKQSVGLFRQTRTPFLLASNRSRLNPWYLIFSISGKTYCASTSVDTCVSALNQMGYKTTEVLW